jgi:integrase
LFAALRSNRDRAILPVAISNGARAAELLGVRGVDLDWGEQLVRVFRKGSDAEQWLPTSPEAFVWICLYLAELGALEPNEPLWWTLRRRDHGDGLRRQPMNYEALRAVFRRVNALLGTHYSMHDLRHTAAIRMSRDEALSMRDVQTILGLTHLSTTVDVYPLWQPRRGRLGHRTTARCRSMEGACPMTWNLRLAAANRGIWKASDLQRRLPNAA